MRRPEDNAFSGEESLAPVNLTVPFQALVSLSGPSAKTVYDYTLLLATPKSLPTV